MFNILCEIICDMVDKQGANNDDIVLVSGTCSSPSSRPWAGRWTTNICDVWPVRCQKYGYLPSRRALPMDDDVPVTKQYNLVPNYTAWWQRHMGVNNLPGLHSTARQLGFESMTYWSQVRHPTTRPPSHSTVTSPAVEHYQWTVMCLCHQAV